MAVTEPMPAGFYNMDCMDAMRQFPDGFFDLAIVDPPYGIGITGKPGGGNARALKTGFNRRSETGRNGEQVWGGYVVPPKSYHAFNDQVPPDAAYFAELKRVSKNQIIWGGNYFLNYLGATSCMIFWDKCRDGLAFADGELAWTSFKKPTRRFRFRWNGLLQEDMKNKEERIHPTQKPVKLYEWLLKNYAKPGYKILDTHVGSASSLIACYRMGYEYWGYEIDPVYYEMAQQRIEKVKQQISIFELEGMT